jgi:hypothetical protein
MSGIADPLSLLKKDNDSTILLRSIGLPESIRHKTCRVAPFRAILLPARTTETCYAS